MPRMRLSLIALMLALSVQLMRATELRLPESIREPFLTLQEEGRHCELARWMNENFQLLLKSNDAQDVWFVLAKHSLSCGDTAVAVTQLEEAFISGLNIADENVSALIHHAKNPLFDELYHTYSKVSERNQINGLWAMYFGMLLTMMIYNLILFISLRESSFLLLALFVFLTLHAFGMYHSELGVFVERIFPWMNHLDFIQRPFVFCINLSLAVYVFFIRRFFPLNHDKWWIRFNNVLLLISVIFCLMAFVGVRLEYFRSPMDAMIIVFGAFLSGIILLWKRVPYAQLFFTANLILTLGYLHAILEVYLGWNEQLLMGVFGPEKLGLILFLLILSLSVSSKINSLKLEKLALQQESVKTLESRVIERTQELHIEKCKVEEKNAEILSSIEYARRIQNAILPPLKMVKDILPDSFILYMPKDIVAGDFYWIEKVDNTIYFAACDCTGHGVPGAMVSVVCNNALNRSLNEFSQREPGKILDTTRQLVIENFAKNDDDVKDGMDISLCAFNTSSNELHWAGANNPLWIYRYNSQTLDEIRPDKQPVGKAHVVNPFQTHRVQLNQGDVLYLFTDGYADQFGGLQGKKFTRAKFKEILLSIAGKSMQEQQMILADNHRNYKGAEEQVDDICVIGVRFN